MFDLSSAKDGFDSMTTWIDALSRSVQFFETKEYWYSIFGSIFKHFAQSDSIVTDHNSKFRTDISKRLIEKSGIHLKKATSRHLQTDGWFAIMKRIVEKCLRCYCLNHYDDWDWFLPSAKLVYNSVVSPEFLETYPFTKCSGWQPRTPLEIISG